MKRIHPLPLSVLTGLLLFAAWPVSPLTFLVFVAFLPLLWLERQGVKGKHFFGWVYIAMLTWNVAATWWVWNATGPGAIGAFLANSLLMCLPWLGFHAVRRRMGNTAGYLSLIVFWLSFEYLHLQNWGLSWPWLTLGNVFAARPGWVQWYEYTGTSGGGLWVLTMNILLFLLAWDWFHHRKLVVRRALVALGVLVVPLGLSLLLTPAPPDKMPAGNVVIIQPNIDPYDKILTGSFDAQLQRLIRLSDSTIDSNTVLVVWPETALYNERGFEEDSLKKNFFLKPLWAFLHRHPRINLLTGIESFRIFDYKHSSTAMKIPDTDKFYESYNAAALMDSSGPVAFYHKSRLVPGAESLPPFLHFMVPLFEKFGATEEGYTGQADRSVFHTTDGRYGIAPAICYESIYGEFMSRYVHNGANIMAVITNDGWWGDTPGYKQHESYARLRAIETRRFVIRSANTGVSCIIEPDGQIIESRPWAKVASIRRPIPTETGQTFYTLCGDCISRIALALALLFFGWNIITIIKTRTSRG
ncbi:apolipoprotein N-acyltransferase [Puia dinghuensis]|uniref:Apolipoprotein N-acyltransferase n=1 Tax=Puia dinghuensis TaxID=1792502 RepID=A0A8J2UIN2_9BACT|nr:apolipoprotein N-acyltransferase [Puia dinghuensis]GGB22553.1 apolipoprotein N-acyltransferase [Puia dinghuensis]